VHGVEALRQHVDPADNFIRGGAGHTRGLRGKMLTS
jgi:hypothetical protein